MKPEPMAPSALTRLPVAYAVALALNDVGVSSDEIARRLGLPADAMPALFEIAAAKLAALELGTTGAGDTPGALTRGVLDVDSQPRTD
jgi:hypothetical protein